MEFNISKCYDKNDEPIPGSLVDERAWARPPEKGHDYGIFGHIELAVPLIHVKYINMIFRLLSTTCRSCGRILLSYEEIIDINRLRNFDLIFNGKISSSTFRDTLRRALNYKWYKECPTCGSFQMPIKLDRPTTFSYIKDFNPIAVRAQIEEAVTEFWYIIGLTPNIIHEWFERISNEDLELLGFLPKGARPQWMIIGLLPVNSDDIWGARTYIDKLANIIKINNMLRDSIVGGAPSFIIRGLESDLQNYITDYINEYSASSNL